MAVRRAHNAHGRDRLRGVLMDHVTTARNEIEPLLTQLIHQLGIEGRATEMAVYSRIQRYLRTAKHNHEISPPPPTSALLCRAKLTFCSNVLSRRRKCLSARWRTEPTRSTDPLKVLFLCTGNSARSILTEEIARSRRINAFTAGSELSGQFNPLAVEFLERHRVDISTRQAKPRTPS